MSMMPGNPCHKDADFPYPGMKRGLSLSRSKVLLASDFNDWWAKNHPLDWWAKDRKGRPLPEADRIRVWALCKRAYEANDRLHGREGSEAE